MQERYKDRRLYFNELANTSRDYYLDYTGDFLQISSETRVLEIGCGEGGNLAPFAEKGCHVCGIDINGGQIQNARRFFEEDGLKGTFIHSDFLSVTIPKTAADQYDLILVHDVIEHIEPPYKLQFFEQMKSFMKPAGIAFFGFPAWQMPFGGHQQICKGRISKIPFLHLLTEHTYRKLLERAGEESSTVEELCSIKRSRMPVERFEKLVVQSEMEVLKRTFWVINPHYKQKFHLMPLREVWPFNAIPYLRNFYTTSAWYLIRQRG